MSNDIRDMISSNREYMQGFYARSVQSVLSSEFGMRITADELRDFLYNHKSLVLSYYESTLIEKYYCALQCSVNGIGPVSVEFISTVYKMVYKSRIDAQESSQSKIFISVIKDLEKAFNRYLSGNSPRFADRLFVLMRDIEASRIYCYNLIGRLVVVRELLQVGYPAVAFRNWYDVALAVRSNDREMFYESLNLMISEECRVMNECGMKVEVEEL